MRFELKPLLGFGLVPLDRLMGVLAVVVTALVKGVMAVTKTTRLASHKECDEVVFPIIVNMRLYLLVGMFPIWR